MTNLRGCWCGEMLPFARPGISVHLLAIRTPRAREGAPSTW